MRNLSKSKFTFTSWLAIGLLLWGALAPTLIHSVSSWMGQEVPWAEICSAAHDPQALSNSQAEPSDTGDGTSQSAHCAYCLLCSPNCLPTSAFSAAIAQFSAVYAPPHTGSSFAPMRRLWASPHTRAPPI
jgi:hypothetical protein